jgi:hypothetical protein
MQQSHKGLKKMFVTEINLKSQKQASKMAII